MLETRGATVEEATQGYTKWKDEHEGAPTRPYRLWDAVQKRDMSHRYFVHPENAIDRALLEAAWAKVGTSIEVYDCRNGSHLATFTHKVTGQIIIWRSPKAMALRSSTVH